MRSHDRDPSVFIACFPIGIMLTIHMLCLFRYYYRVGDGNTFSDTLSFRSLQAAGEALSCQKTEVFQKLALSCIPED